MLNPIHICFVDDEVEVCSLMLLIFRKEVKEGRYKISTAHSGQECLDLLELKENNDIRLIFTDLNMPQMDGFTLLDKLKIKHKDISAYVVSAYSDPRKVKEALERGAIDYIEKPIEIGKIANIIEKYI